MKLIDLHDLIKPSLLLVLNIADRLSFGRQTRDTTRTIAGFVTAVRRRKTQAKIRSIGHVLRDRPINLSYREMIVESLGKHFEETLLRYRGWPEDAAASPVVLEGREHIDRALDEGKGLILWRAPLLLDSMVVKVALNEAGYSAAVLGRPQHGISFTKFGHLGLNRLAREREGLLRVDCIVVRGDGQRALAEVRQRLAQNGIVSINARFHSDNPVELPFFDGRITIATGPPRLALATGAALIPIFSLRDENGHFRVVVHPPLDVDDTTDHATATHLLMQRFIASLEAHVLCDPAIWPDWRVNVVGS